MAPKLGYWAIRGYAQPIRLLLAHAGVEYEDKLYSYKVDGDTIDRSEWLNEKFTLGLDFPNLPYYLDGDVKLSQTLAILKYVGRKYGLAPKTEAEQIRADLIEAEALDIRANWSKTCYSPNFEELKPDFLKNLANKLKDVSAFLGSHAYFAGETLTYVDFLMYELLDQHNHLEPNTLNDHPNLKEFHARIKGLENVAAYLKSDKCIVYPLNGVTAAFGGK